MSNERDKAEDESVRPMITSEEASPVVDDQTENLQNAVVSEVDNALTGKERVDLGIDWNSLDMESLFANLKKYDNAENTHPPVPKSKNPRYIIHTGELKTRSGVKLVLEVSKVISPNYHELHITIEGRPQYRHVGESAFLQRKHDKFPLEVSEGCEEWDMKHRITAPLYREQGIAAKVLDILGEILKKRSQDNQLEQSIVANSGQKTLTAWLENSKRGFVPATPKDEENLARLRTNDPDLQKIKVPKGSYAAGEVYTFDTKEFKEKFGDKLSGPEDPAVWDVSNHNEPFYYMWSCFKIKMKKNI